MQYIVLYVVLYGLIERVSSLDTPFSINYQSKYYKSNYSDQGNLTIVSIDSSESSNISLKLGGRFIGNSTIMDRHVNISVHLYPSLSNMNLTIPSIPIKIKAFCKFSYPITVVASTDSYKCIMSYKDSSNQHRVLGKCMLNLQYKSTFCFVEGSVETKHLSDKQRVFLGATIYRCSYQCESVMTTDWRSIVNTSLSLALSGWEQLTWVRVQARYGVNIGLLIGVSNNPINTHTTFDIPIRLETSYLSQHVKSLNMQVRFNKQLSMEDITPGECFIVSQDWQSYEEGSVIQTEVAVKRVASDQCLKSDRNLLMVFRMSASEEAKNLSMQIIIDKAVINEKHFSYNISQDKINNKTFFEIPLFQGTYTIIHMMDNPVVLPSLENVISPHQLKDSDLKIYLYDNIWITDVSNKVKCRPFNPSTLRCPPSMQPLNPIVTAVHDLNAVKWSLELMIDNSLIVLTVQPQARPDGDWQLRFTDSVLNLIDGWTAVRRSRDASLMTASRCYPVYQVESIQLYKRIYFHNRETNESMETIADLSAELKERNIRLSNGIGVVKELGNSMIVQGLNPGSLDIQLVTNDNDTLLKGSMMVYNAPVTVTDLDIACISSIDITNKVVFSSSSIRIANFNFKIQSRSSPHRCFLTVHIIFSDKTRTNILAFPKDQYTLKFVTNTVVLDSDKLNNSWYDYDIFKKAQSFYVELQESAFCVNPRTIFKKYFSLSDAILGTTTTTMTPSTMDQLSTTSHSKVETASNGSVGMSYRKEKNNRYGVIEETKLNPEKPKVFKSIALVIIAVVSVVIIIVSVNILVRCYMTKKSLSQNNWRRKSLTAYDINNMPANDINYPPLLPPPGPQVQLSDPSSVTISSPHSFWCLDPKKTKKTPKMNQFVRQSSLPFKGYSSRGCNEIAPCPPLRWINKMLPTSSINTCYSSQDGLNTTVTKELLSCSPMTWSVTNMDIEASSGVGSLNTNIDEFIKDPYGSKERFHKLSELPFSNSTKIGCLYDII